MPAPSVPPISRSADIAADPQRVWAIVSDLPRMGELSPENTGGRWVGRATGPAVGAVFRGTNQRGRRRWSTRAVVQTCEPGRTFSFDVSVLGLPISRWTYDLKPTSEGCRLTESWSATAGRLMQRLGRLTTGEPDREAFTVRSIDQTLARVKERAQTAGP